MFAVTKFVVSLFLVVVMLLTSLPTTTYAQMSVPTMTSLVSSLQSLLARLQGTQKAQVVSAVPYTLPAPGQAVAIGTNYADNVKPAGWSSFNWAYTTFNCYASGILNPSFSTAGAYVIASNGGHKCPDNTGATVFDFTDATWKQIDNTNGVPSLQTGFPDSSAVAPYGELLGATTGQVPAPSHLFHATSYIPPSLGGGPKGSFLKLTNRFTTVTPLSFMGAHRMDLATGLWTRATNDLFSPNQYDFYSGPNVVFDNNPGNERYYLLSADMHKQDYMVYLDPKDWRIKRTVTYPYLADYTGTPGTGQPSFMLDPVRRIIISTAGPNAITGAQAWKTRAIDLITLQLDGRSSIPQDRNQALVSTLQDGSIIQSMVDSIPTTTTMVRRSGGSHRLPTGRPEPGCMIKRL
jgi:hypothetical protein